MTAKGWEFSSVARFCCLQWFCILSNRRHGRLVGYAVYWELHFC